MTGIDSFNIRNFIGFRGNIAPAKTDEAKTQTGATLPPALERDTFVKSKPAEPEKIVQEETTDICAQPDDYDEEYELEQQEWFKQKIQTLNEAAENLEALSLTELQNVLFVKSSVEYDAPNAGPTYKEIADAIISKVDKESINSKETADFLLAVHNSNLSDSEECEEAYSRILVHFSTLLHEEGKERYQANFNTLREAFKDIDAELTGRVKTAKSIEGKLPRATTTNIKKGASDIFNATQDICGYRLVTDGSPEQSEKVLAQIEKLVDEGKCTLYSIVSHGEEPYIAKDAIIDLCNNKKCGYTIKTYPGFTGTNVILKDENGKTFELQIIGKEVNKINIKEHKFYKLWTMSPEEHCKYFKSRHEIDAYGEYTEDCYTYARGLELGTIDPECEKPELPEGLCEELRLI